MNLNDSMRAAHVMVCGDAGVGKPLRVRQIAEESLAAGRTVIYLSNNAMCHGLASAFTIARFSVSSHGLDLTAEDGARFARHVMTSRTSVALNLRALERHDLTSFLAGLMGALNRSEDADVDVFFECLDDMIKRKRHSDRDATNELHSMLLRGPKATGGNGVRVVMGATSPNEVPIEAGNTSLTLIGTRTAGDPNMQAMSNYAGGTPRLYRCATVYSASIAAVDDRHQWLWPKSEGIRAPHMPYFCPLYPLVSDAGGDGPFGLEDTQQIESDFVEAIVLQRSGDESAAQDNAPAARRATRQRAKARRTVARKSKVDSSHRKLHASGLTHAGHRVSIARLAMKIRDGYAIDANVRRPIEQVIDEMADQRYDVAARWSAIASHRANVLRTSLGLLGFVYAEMRPSSPSKTDAFFEDLAVNGHISRELRAELESSDAPMISPARLEMVRKALSTHLGDQHQTAANDDNAIAQAI